MRLWVSFPDRLRRMLYTVPPDPYTSAQSGLVATAPRGEVGIVLAELGVVAQRYDAVKEVLEGKGP